jgi:hypothetical protein
MTDLSEGGAGKEEVGEGYALGRLELITNGRGL